MGEVNSLEQSGSSRVLTVPGSSRSLADVSDDRGNSVLTPYFVWRAVARWWRVALPVGVLLAVAAGSIAWILSIPLYQAEAWLRIEDRRPFVAFPEYGDSRLFVQTQVELIKSPLVLGQVLSEPEIAQLPDLRESLSPIDWLSERLMVAPVGSSELYRISFYGPDPESAALVANAVMDVYLKFHSDQAAMDTQRVIELLDKEKERRVRELERLKENVRTLTKQATGKDPVFVNPGIVMTQTPLGALQDRLATAEVERQLLEARVSVTRESLEAEEFEVPASLVEQGVAADPTVQSMQMQIAQTRQQLLEYERVARDPEKSGSVRMLQRKLQNLEQSLREVEEEAREAKTQELMAMAQARRHEELKALEAQLENQRYLEQILHQRLAEERNEMEKLGDQTLTLEFARSEMQRAEEVFQRITERVTALRTEQSAPARIAPMQLATPPLLREDDPIKVVSLAALGGFFFPFVVAVGWERAVRKVSNVEQIATETRLPVVGEITTLPVRSLLPGRRAVNRFERHRSTFEESIAYLRTSLMLCNDLQDPQVLAVASSVSREGKTNLAAQLAVSLASSSGAATLLIDTDLRHPEIHKLFGVPLDPGLAGVLERRCALDEAVITTWSERVHLLPAGRLTRSPLVLFGNGAFRGLLEEARKKYRYIVMDSPPLLSASEALVVAKAADGTLLCTMHEFSRLGQVRQAIDRLTAANAGPLCLVLNGVPPEKYAARYGGYANLAYQRQSWGDEATTAADDRA